MRAVLQRVSTASVAVNNSIISQINKGLCLLIGITTDDTEKDVDWMVNKITTLRVFEDENGRSWSKSVKDLDLEILSVSQFTLYALTSKGTKPDFHLAMKSDESKPLYTQFVAKLGQAHKPERVKDGEFGAMMQVQIVNEGPITLTLDSRTPRSGNGTK
ncbi:D-tyrosyl-tRNA deacylase [Phlyctochytrium arcticum]|nr:D-tyrosyl-tRNA deacylase [Phlyctochytrium arcticum]